MSGGMFMLQQKKRAAEARLKELRDAFKRADKDGDGALSQEEWSQVLKQAGVEMSREEMAVMFAEKDRDFDGKLSFEEFAGQETKLERAFKAMDKDGDGFITKGEFKKLCRNLTSDQVEVAFAKFDKAGNGKLNYREFCGMMNARKLKAEAAALEELNSPGASSPSSHSSATASTSPSSLTSSSPSASAPGSSPSASSSTERARSSRPPHSPSIRRKGTAKK